MCAASLQSAPPSTEEPTISRGSWVWDLGYLLFALILFQEVVFGGARFVDRDLLRYFHPIGHLIQQAFQGDGSFWWDPGVNHGIPLAARWAPAVFYPAHWLFALLRIDLALAVSILAHLLIAAMATRRLATRYTEHPAATWLAGLCFGFGGYLVSMIGGGIYLYGAALLPLSLLALHRIAERPSLGRSLQLAGVLALQLCNPDPQTLYFELLVCCPILLWLRVARGRRLLVLGAAGLSGALAICVSWCQLWPTAELSSLSIRAAGLGQAEAALWSMHPLRLVEWLVPGVFGDLFPDASYWAGWLTGSSVANRPWATACHVGLVALVAIPAFRRVDRRAAWAWGGLVLLFLLLAMGRHTPLHGLAWWIPGVDRFRYPEKHLLFVSLGLALLAATGIGRVFQALEGGAPVARRLLLILGGLVALLAAARIWVWIGRERLGELIFSGGARVVTSDAVSATTMALTRSLAIAATLFGVLALRARLRGKLAVGLVLGVAAVELLLAALPLRLLGGKEWAEGAPGVCAAIPVDPSGLRPLVWHNPLDYEGDPPGLRGPASSAERHNRWEHRVGKPNVAAPFCLRYANGYDAATLRVHADLHRALGRDPAREMDLLGVRYIIARPRQLPATYPQRAELRDWRVAVHENPGALPYAHPVASAIRAETSRAAIARVADPSFDFRRAVVLEGGSARSFPPALRRAELLRHRAGAIELSVEFAQPGYLLLLESHYPGWRAWIDERPAAVHRANGAFLGLEIAAGKHRVKLAFVPDRQRVANWVSLAGLGILGALTVVAMWRRRLSRLRNPS